MRRRSEQSLVFFAMVFVFACLLLSGGPRLIGHEEEESGLQIQSVPLVSAAFSAAPAPAPQSGFVPQRAAVLEHGVNTAAAALDVPHARVMCDANGNILGSATYLHAVYQAFSLGDGFV